MNHSERPNILWICTDQQRYDTLGCTVNRFVRTPNLDALARCGVQFDSAYCQAPVCTPSRASFLTGRYPRTCRTRQNGQNIPDDEVLVTKLLADVGYVGGLSGKLHLSACHPSVCPAAERRINDGYAVFHWSHGPGRFGAKGHDWPAHEYNLWLREQNAVYETSVREDCRYVHVGMPAALHQTTWCARKAATFVRTMTDFDAPWFFSLNLFDPHHPFDPPVEYLARYLDQLDEIPLPNYRPGELAGKPVFQQIDHHGAYGNTAGFSYPEMTDHDHRLITAACWAMGDLIDDAVGDLLQTVKATGQEKNTLVIFMSDHGELLGDHGMYLKAPHFYEPSVHVPLIVSGPGVRQGVRSSALVELLDVAPTLLEASGQTCSPGMQGKSLWPLLTGETSLETHRDDVYSEFFDDSPYGAHPPANVTMLRTRTHKIVAAHGVPTGTVGGELYDLTNDPDEFNNLWDTPAHTNLKLDLVSRLCTRIAETFDPLPPRIAPW